LGALVDTVHRHDQLPPTLARKSAMLRCRVVRVIRASLRVLRSRMW
jgi:hypothetical protein